MFQGTVPDPRHPRKSPPPFSGPPLIGLRNWGQDHAEALDGMFVPRRAAVALGGPAALARAGVAAPAEHAGRARCGTLRIRYLAAWVRAVPVLTPFPHVSRSEEHTSELQSP